jgi:diguanylate cyclase
VRESDTVARMGGDEFTVILSELQDAPDAARVAQRLVSAIEAPLVISGQEVGVTASVGVSLYPADGNSAELLARHADMALYRAKQEGKNTVRFFAPEMNAEALERVKLESALRGALERQEFSVHYQPLMTADGRTRSFEALLRWRHETLGVVTPDRFIPAAEDAGLIVPIGAWVLDEALRQIAVWRAEGFADLCVAVNVSPVQLARDDFVRTVSETLQRHGLDGSSLELEVTERSIVRDFERTSSRLEALRWLGVSVSVDDFGAGQSSLAYLLRLPVDVLKVDRSFVAAMHASGSEARVVPAMVALAHALGLSVVAEGVETPAQLDALSQLGCERLQGYLLGRPVPAEDVRRWLEAASTED